jgi:gluconate 5-dehydrogenase
VTAAFLVTQAVGRRSMIPNRYGKIITVASVAGMRGNMLREQRSLAYNTAKGALVNFTRALATEWARYDINVNALAPGFFPTKLSKVMLDRVGPRLIERLPLGRFGSDQDLKGAAILLASDASSYITGQILAVDGGLSAS